MNHRVQSFRYFIPISLLYLAYYLWNLMQGGAIPSEWILSGLAFAVGIGSIWSLVPSMTQTDHPTLNEFIPVVMLMVFLFILITVGQRIGTASLLHTIGALLYFRSLLFVLKRFRSSSFSLPVAFLCMCLGLTLGLISQCIFLMASFKGFTSQMIEFANVFAVKGAFALVVVAIGYGFKENKLSKNHP